MTTSQRAGVASSIWTNKTRSFAVAWWLSNNFLANAATEALMQRIMLTGHGKAAWSSSSSSSKVHCDTTARQLMMEVSEKKSG